MKTGLEILDSPELFTHKELAGVMPELTAHEAEMLRKSIVEAGVVYEPIDFFELDGQRIIVDGHHRYSLARAMGIPFRAVRLADVRTVYQAREYMFSVAQHRRRNLSRRKASYVRGLHFNQAKAQGERTDKTAAGGGAKGSTSGQSGRKSTCDELAELYGIKNGGRTIRREGKFAEHVDALKAYRADLATALLDDDCHVKPKDLERAESCAAQAWRVVVERMVRDGLSLEEACRKVGTSVPRSKVAKKARGKKEAAAATAQVPSFYPTPGDPAAPPPPDPKASPTDQRAAFETFVRHLQNQVASGSLKEQYGAPPDMTAFAQRPTFGAFSEMLSRIGPTLPPSVTTSERDEADEERDADEEESEDGEGEEPLAQPIGFTGGMGSPPAASPPAPSRLSASKASVSPPWVCPLTEDETKELMALLINATGSHPNAYSFFKLIRSRRPHLAGELMSA